MKKWKGILLAGGSGTRLYPLTYCISKQLLPVYDKPMIYYPLSVLLNSGIREIAIITTDDQQILFKNLLKDGSQWGCNFTYIAQKHPNGIAEAFLLCQEFIKDCNVALILGDNIFFGLGLQHLINRALQKNEGATVFGYRVQDPERYGVVEFDTEHRVLSIEEKPIKPKSNYAVTGLYFYDSTVLSKAFKIRPSKRGELEITDINNLYLQDKKLNVEIMSRGIAWLDTGTHSSLLSASTFIETIETRQGLMISSPEEIALKKGYISKSELKSLADPLAKTEYGKYLLNLVK